MFVRRSDHVLDCDLWLGAYVQQRRIQLGLTMAVASELAGIHFSDWFALEYGWIPDDPVVLHAVSGTLMTNFNRLSLLAGVGRSAQQICKPEENQ